MNVFAAHPDPAESAQALADRHVVKMVLETAQILSTVAHELGVDTEGLYRPTHRHHPCTVAVVQDPAYAAWVAAHGMALGAEYTRRFGKVHKSTAVVAEAARRLQLGAVGTPTRFPLAMPDEYKVRCPHVSYRSYLKAKYATWGDAARWTNATRPTWA